MDIENWCPVCDKRIDDVEEQDEDMDMDNLPPSMQEPRITPTLPNGPQHKSSKSKSGHPRVKPHAKRTHSSARLAMKGLKGHQSHKSVESAKATEEEVARDKWKGFYCSMECMKADELSSRLALSNLSSSSMPFPSTSTYRRPSSNSSRGYSSDDLPSPTMLPGRQQSQSGLNDYFSSQGSAYSTIRRNGRPSALGLGSQNNRTANDWGSSDSLASRNSPHDVSYSVSRSSKSGLRAMTPIHSTFAQSGSAMARSTSVESQLRNSSSDDDQYSAEQVTQPKPAKTPTYPLHSKSRSVSAIRSGIMPAASAANPVLSQGAEGNAYGTVFSRSLTSAEYQPMGRPKMGRHNSSSASIPHLSCSPSSPASSTWSTRSTYSTNSSNAPSDGYASKSEHFNGHHRNRSSLSVPFVSASQRTPSYTALPSYFSRSPPARSSKMSGSSFSDSQGTISRIIHEKAAQKYKASSPPNHHQFDDSGLYPAISASSPGEATPTQSEGHLKRIGSNASVVSLPHYFTAKEETMPSRGSMMNLEAGKMPGSGTSPASAGKGWNWDPSMAQYTAMRKKGDGERKRLFFFNENAQAQK